MGWRLRARGIVPALLCMAVLSGCGSDDDGDITDPIDHQDPTTGDQSPPPTPSPTPEPDPTPQPEPEPEPDPNPEPDPEPDPDPAPVNQAPTISGSPATSIVVGDAYRFTPTANDADGDVLHFEIENKPAWASFDSSSGALTGTPEEADIGEYSNVVIRVTDGEATTQLPPFSITVHAVGSGTATLTWTAPTQRTDGSALTNLAGYRIYWGTESRNYTKSVEIDNPAVTSYVIENLGPGTHYFATTAVDANGAESAYSNEATKTIQ